MLTMSIQTHSRLAFCFIALRELMGSQEPLGRQEPKDPR